MDQKLKQTLKNEILGHKLEKGRIKLNRPIAILNLNGTKEDEQ